MRLRRRSARGQSISGFEQLCDAAFYDVVRRYGFEPVPDPAERVSPYLGFRAYRNGKRYVRVEASTEPRDPPLCEVSLGEGGLEWPESDWNNLALFQFKSKEGRRHKSRGSYRLGDVDELPKVLTKLAADLEWKASDFLRGDLRRFLAMRSRQARRRKPYQIYKPDAQGRYRRCEEPESAALRKRFAADVSRNDPDGPSTET